MEMYAVTGKHAVEMDERRRSSLVKGSGTMIGLLLLYIVRCTGVTQAWQKWLSQNTTVWQVQYENLSRYY